MAGRRLSLLLGNVGIRCQPHRRSSTSMRSRLFVCAHAVDGWDS
jgi:hypothetical protein